MMFVCRPDVLLVSLSLLACATRVVQAGYIDIGNTVALESAPNRHPSGRFVKAGTATEKDYTLVGKDDCDQFTLNTKRGVQVGGVYTQDYVWLGLGWMKVMSCKSNGFGKGDKCRTRHLCEDISYDEMEKYICRNEEFELLIHPGTDGLRLQDGDMVQFKNIKKGECVNNRDDSKVDLDRCNRDSAKTYWKIHKV